MKLILIFVLIIITFNNFVSATDDTDITEFLSRRDILYSLSTVNNRTLYENSYLMKRAGSCPSGYYPVSGNNCCQIGSYQCTDGEGGCCDNGTTCLPNFKCSGKGSSGIPTFT